MSVVVRHKRLVPSPIATPAPVTTVSRPARHHVEAPEWGEQRREAPESRSVRRSETPESGEGRGCYMEHEFTHGRSQTERSGRAHSEPLEAPPHRSTGLAFPLSRRNPDRLRVVEFAGLSLTR